MLGRHGPKDIGMTVAIQVSKSARTLTVLRGGEVVATYPCCTGKAGGDKEREGDCKTPEGVFRVCYKNPRSKFRLSLGLSYPDAAHAARGLAGGMISREQHDQLVRASELTAAANAEGIITRADGVVTVAGADWETLWKTPLGGEVMIHGGGAGRDGTAGCVGLEDADIAKLYPIVEVGTVVEIRP